MTHKEEWEKEFEEWWLYSDQIPSGVVPRRCSDKMPAHHAYLAVRRKGQDRIEELETQVKYEQERNANNVRQADYQVKQLKASREVWKKEAVWNLEEREKLEKALSISQAARRIVHENLDKLSVQAEKWEEENEQLREDNNNLWEGIKLLRRGLREEADAILEKVLMRIRRRRERCNVHTVKEYSPKLIQQMDIH